MPLPINQALEAIETGMHSLGRTFTAGLLRPGLPPEQTRTDLGERGLVPSDELVELYGWHDGTDALEGTTLDDMHLFPGFYFASLKEALTNYDAFRDDRRWNPDWLPVFANGGGDFLAVTCSEEPNTRGEVIHFRIEESEHPVEFASVSRLLNTVAAAYLERVYFIDEDGYLEMDDSVFSEVARRLNPDVAWWQD
ncbi:SMI1/KNR4 family protein [Pedococcus sp. KACC 23699]|uniref:SMI1/KNR4 family protein n=1 Tax=Pedococcus sp. KACC 23699 TaxID=3149228 RepID=A0AAU7JS03_9MICO